MSLVCVGAFPKVDNPRLEQRYTAQMARLSKPDNVAQLFHGTRPECAACVVLQGFRNGTGGTFGAGVYFAESAESKRHAVSGPPHRLFLLCDVQLGRVYETKRAKHHFTGRGPRSCLPWAKKYDSLVARGRAHRPEYIIHEPTQAMPRYVLEFGAALPACLCSFVLDPLGL